MAEGEDPRIVAEFSDYNELITALRLRAAELNLSGEQCDLLSGLPARYSQKLLGPNQIRRLGAISLGPFLGALAVRGLLVEDSVALEKLRRQTKPRRNEYVRSAVTLVTLRREFMREIGRLGARARVDNSTPAQRRKWARAAIKTRFENSTMKQRQAWARTAVIAHWRKANP